MNQDHITNGIVKAISIISGVALFLWFLFQIRSVIAYLAIAAVIALIGLPIVNFLKTKLKFRDTFAVVVTMFIFIGFIVQLMGIVVPLIIEQGKNLSLLNIQELELTIETLYDHFISHFGITGLDIEQSIKDSQLLSELDFSIIPDFLNSVVSGFGSFSIALFSILFIAFFFLLDTEIIERSIMAFVPKGKEKRSKKSLDTIKNLLSRYFIGLVFQILILFTIYTVVLLIFGIDNAFVIAFLCALLNLIPYVGPVIGGILMLMLTMSSNLGESFSEVILPKSFHVMIGFLIGQLVDNFFSQPFIFSKSVKSHPLEIFLIIIIAGVLFGVVGLIIAIPTYTAIKVILKEFMSENKIVKALTKNM